MKTICGETSLPRPSQRICEGPLQTQVKMTINVAMSLRIEREEGKTLESCAAFSQPACRYL
jgi:hypothetical protein